MSARSAPQSPALAANFQEFERAKRNLNRQLTAALEARSMLAVAAAAAKKNGRPRDWFLGKEDPSQPFVGLRNEGATCYLNSLIQGLFILPEVRELIFSFHYDPNAHGDPETCVPLQLGRIFAALQCSTRKALSTKALTTSFGWSAAESFRQHDVQELCSVLFDALGKFGCQLGSLFDGEIRNTVRCLECGYESTRNEAFLDLGVDVGECCAVDAALRKLVAWEHMEGEGTWRCEQCNARRSARGTHVARLPSTFVMLQLKRFVFDMATLQRKKLNHRVELPMTLDLGALLSTPTLEEAAGSTPPPPDKEAAAAAAAAAEAKEEKEEEEGASSDLFDCVGVMVHSGSAQGGHYTALLRPGPASQFYEFNDAIVQAAGESRIKVAEGEGEIGASGGSGTNAYLLVYKRRAAGHGIGDAEAVAAAVPTPPAELARELEEEEADAVKLREWQRLSDQIVEVTVLLDRDLLKEVTITLLCDATADELCKRACHELLGATAPSEAAGAARLRQWSFVSGGSRADEGAVRGDATLGSLGLAPKACLLLETRPTTDAAAMVPWPAPSSMDLFVRVTLWSAAATAGAAAAGDAAAEEGVDKAGESSAGGNGGGAGGDGGAMLCVPSGLEAKASLADLRAAIEARFGVPCALQRLVRPDGPSAPALIAAVPDANDAAAALAPATEEAFSPDATCTLAQLRIKQNDAFLLEAVSSAADGSALLEALEQRKHSMTISYNKPGEAESAQTVQADGREMLSQLKSRIAAALGEDASALRLRRAARGTHLKAEETTPIGEKGASLTEGSAVYVERGAPLMEDDLLIHVYWAADAGAGAAGAGADAAAAAGGGGGGGAHEIDPLATKSTTEPCLTLAISETLKVSDLKAKLVDLLGLVGGGCSPQMLRVYKRSGARTGVVLRDGRKLRQSLTGGFDDKEIVVQRLAADELLTEATLLVKFTLLDEAGSPKPSQLLRAQSSWSMAELLGALSASSGIASDELSLAKPPTVGGSNVTSAMIAKLKWDDPKILATPKIGSHPLQLRDGDGLLLRAKGAATLGSKLAGGGVGGEAAAASGVAPKLKPWQQGGRGRGRGSGSGGAMGDVVVAGGGRGGTGGSRPERGVVIRTMYDEPPSATAKENVAPPRKEAEEQQGQGGGGGGGGAAVSE